MWVVEIEIGSDRWESICYCENKKQADAVADKPHIVADGRPVRVRKYGYEY